MTVMIRIMSAMRGTKYKMTGHRKPPYKAVMALHLPRVRGKCQWCGLPTAEMLESGKLRFWHKDCETEFKIIVFPQTARSRVRQRDKGICSDCGAPPGFCDKTFTEAWQVDHHIPLWKVAEMEPLKRIEYFKLHNLITRCTDCHKTKSRREASERAHGRSVRGERKVKLKRKMASRPFGPGRKFPAKGSVKFRKA